MRPTSELERGEAWGEQQPASRTVPRPSAPARTIARSSPDRTQPLPSRLPSSRTLPPSAARTNNTSQPASYRSSRAAPPKQDDAEIEQLGQQIMELMERLRASDERAAYLEQQLTHMTHMANAAAAAATAAPLPTLPLAEDFSRPRAANNSWIAWTAFGLLGALVAAAYAFGYTPLRSSYEEQVKQNALQASQSAQALASLRTSFGEERQRFESQLAAAQAAASAAAAAPVEPAAPTSRSRSSAADSDDEDDSSEHSRLTPEERAAKSAERKAAYEAKKAERLAKREERKAAALERKAAREEGSASRKHGSSSDDEDVKPARAAKPAPSSSSSSRDGDDPLEGLDGL